MKRLYRFINILFLLSITLYLWDIFYMDHPVNNISFSKELGDNEHIDFGRFGFIYQHYQLDTFENRQHLKNELTGCLLDTTIIFKEEGLLTIRFLVNKAGEADRFRPVFIDAQYRALPPTVDEQAIKHVIACLKTKKSWQKGTVQGKPRKYHTYMNLRIENGRIDDFF